MPSSDERTTNDWSQDRSWNDAEESAPMSTEQAGTEQANEVQEKEKGTLDAPSTPEPSWRPETPAWDRPTPRSETMPTGSGWRWRPEAR